MRFTMIHKVLVIIILVFFMLIPLNWIQGLIQSRAEREEEAVSQIHRNWAGPLNLTGPYLMIPYTVRHYTDDGKSYTSVRKAYFLAEKLSLEGRLSPQTRNYGIFETTIFTGDLTLRGTLAPPRLQALSLDPSRMRWDQAQLICEFQDMRALTRQVKLSLKTAGGTEELPFEADTPLLRSGGGSLRAALGRRMDRAYRKQQPVSFQVGLSVKGSRGISFHPLAKETRANLQAPWNSPGFNGNYLPQTRKITDQGFSARWEIPSLTRTFPQEFAGESRERNRKIRDSRFGVDLVIPTNSYQLASRAVKHGIIFLILPFLACFLFEILGRQKIHLFQYALIGISLSLFFLILLALAEHIPFPAAYTAAAVPVALLTAFYTASSTESPRQGLLILGELSLLYLFLYTTLQSEDYALLLGALGLFVTLALTMILTRKIDWYEMGSLLPSRKTKTPVDKE